LSKSEAETQKLIMQYLKAAGIFAWRQNSGRRGGVSYGLLGSPDIIGMTKQGRFLGIEVKADKGVLSDSQKHFMEQCQASGGLYIVARSLDDVLGKL
jgi:hypothetical protein